MSKQVPPNKFQQNRVSLRNFKLNKINKHIENWFTITQSDGGISNDDKQNFTSNPSNPFNRVVSSSSPKGAVASSHLQKLHSESTQMKQKITVLENELHNKKTQIDRILAEKAQLEQIIKYLQAENINLRLTNQSIQPSSSRHQQHQLNPPSDDALDVSDAEGLKEPQEIDSKVMIELHSQNSRLLQIITQLTYASGSHSDTCQQAVEKKNQNAECQVDYLGIDQLQIFCQSYGLKWTGNNPIMNFTQQIEQYLCHEVFKQTEPLRCQIELLEEVVKSTKRQHQEKVGYLTRLLEEAQKTIIRLIGEMKQFERDSQKHYRLYLSGLKRDATLE